MDSLIRRLASVVGAAATPEIVEISGAWSSSKRRIDPNPSRAEGGGEPQVDVVDHFWRGRLSCGTPLAAFAFLVTPETIFWVRAAPAATGPTVEVSIHAREGSLPGRATLTGRILESRLPGVAFACGEDPITTCALGGASTTTGRAHPLARVPDVSVVLVLVPKSLIEVGRNRLWRFRDDLLSSESADLGVFAHGRGGRIDREASQAPMPSTTAR